MFCQKSTPKGYHIRLFPIFFQFRGLDSIGNRTLGLHLVVWVATFKKMPCLLPQSLSIAPIPLFRLKFGSACIRHSHKSVLLFNACTNLEWHPRFNEIRALDPWQIQCRICWPSVFWSPPDNREISRWEAERQLKHTTKIEGKNPKFELPQRCCICWRFSCFGTGLWVHWAFLCVRVVNIQRNKNAGRSAGWLGILKSLKILSPSFWATLGENKNCFSGAGVSSARQTGATIGWTLGSGSLKMLRIHFVVILSKFGDFFVILNYFGKYEKIFFFSSKMLRGPKGIFGCLGTNKFFTKFVQKDARMLLQRFKAPWCT